MKFYSLWLFISSTVVVDSVLFFICLTMGGWLVFDQQRSFDLATQFIPHYNTFNAVDFLPVFEEDLRWDAFNLIFAGKFVVAFDVDAGERDTALVLFPDSGKFRL